MAASTSTVGNKCYNSECKELRPDRPRKGWRLRAGDFADLCDRCGSIYEEGKFCETFHPNASGWRCCESCGKRVHCGCIVSAQAFALLDPGGIECVSCARKSYIPNLSEEASSSKKPLFSIYSAEVEAFAFALMNILEEPLSEGSFATMKFILANLHEQTIPQALSSACALLSLDFWHDFEEYDDACADQEALAQHNKQMEDAPPGQGLKEEDVKLEAEVDGIDNEISSTEAEILRLQARVISLREARAIMENQREELQGRIRAARVEEETKHREFALQKISVSRIAAKESVRVVVLADLSVAFRTMEKCRKYRTLFD